LIKLPIMGVAVLVLAGCMTNMPPSQAGMTTSPKKVLVAGENTAFKRSVVARVIEKLGTQEWYLKVIGLDQLPAENTAEYGAVLLLAHFWGGKLDKRVTGYLKQDPANPKVVLLYTRGVDGPLPESVRLDLRVDAVSSASRADRVEARAAELATLLAKRF
jgi:hypothetical protein